ncbi:hypothetical protein J6590_082613 [Homalodisca vitripennis]|nr:hypothetical protein J6590_082613 [Homalodisca vitripennis]
MLKPRPLQSPLRQTAICKQLTGCLQAVDRLSASTEVPYKHTSINVWRLPSIVSIPYVLDEPLKQKTVLPFAELQQGRTPKGTETYRPTDVTAIHELTLIIKFHYLIKTKDIPSFCSVQWTFRNRCDHFDDSFNTSGSDVDLLRKQRALLDFAATEANDIFVLKKQNDLSDNEETDSFTACCLATPPIRYEQVIVRGRLHAWLKKAAPTARSRLPGIYQGLCVSNYDISLLLLTVIGIEVGHKSPIHLFIEHGTKSKVAQHCNRVHKGYRDLRRYRYSQRENGEFAETKVKRALLQPTIRRKRARPISIIL